MACYLETPRHGVTKRNSKRPSKRDWWTEILFIEKKGGQSEISGKRNKDSRG